MKNIEKDLKHIFEGLLSSRDSELRKNYSLDLETLIQKIDIDKPELFYFQNKYDQEGLERIALETILSQKNIKSELFVDLYLNYSHILEYLSAIFKDKLGYTCSTDKAHFVLRRIMNSELRLHKKRLNNHKKTYTDPLVKNYQIWLEVIKTCPILYPSRAIKHKKAMDVLLTSIDTSLKYRKEYISKFVEFFMQSKYSELELINGDKIYKYKNIFITDPTNSFHYFRLNHPEIVKIYNKNLKSHSRLAN